MDIHLVTTMHKFKVVRNEILSKFALIRDMMHGLSARVILRPHVPQKDALLPALYIYCTCFYFFNFIVSFIQSFIRIHY